MESSTSYIWTALVISSCILSWTAQGFLYKRIKKYHYQKWVDIGEPGFQTMISNDVSKFEKANLTFKYFIKGDIELDADKRVRKLKIINNVIFLAVPVVIIAFVILSL
ncbi:MAG TPA: hypothetical protein VK153_02795 [Candidatus Paceibacterota bacterium]|nr:hypothetical protein [Candidatus Paceibacterota bacterium]